MNRAEFILIQVAKRFVATYQGKPGLVEIEVERVDGVNHLKVDILSCEPNLMFAAEADFTLAEAKQYLSTVALNQLASINLCHSITFAGNRLQ